VFRAAAFTPVSIWADIARQTGSILAAQPTIWRIEEAPGSPLPPDPDPDGTGSGG
jgi:hypothetical protein